MYSGIKVATPANDVHILSPEDPALKELSESVYKEEVPKWTAENAQRKQQAQEEALRRRNAAYAETAPKEFVKRSTFSEKRCVECPFVDVPDCKGMTCNPFHPGFSVLSPNLVCLALGTACCARCKGKHNPVNCSTGERGGGLCWTCCKEENRCSKCNRRFE